jgi:hypothetical protein
MRFDTGTTQANVIQEPNVVIRKHQTARQKIHRSFQELFHDSVVRELRDVRATVI